MVGWLLGGQPGADGTVQRVGVDAGQRPAHGRLTRWPEGPGPRVTADPERGQHLPGRVRCPLTDRGQRSGAGQHCGHRYGQHGGKGVPPAAPVAGVADLGEVVEQVTIVLGRQRSGRVQPLGNCGNGG
jgi:hypothetical protein